jgi:hypothetical protein
MDQQPIHTTPSIILRHQLFFVNFIRFHFITLLVFDFNFLTHKKRFEIYKEIRLKYEFGKSLDCCFYFQISFLFTSIQTIFLISISTTAVLLFYYEKHLDVSYLYHYIVTCGIFPFFTFFFSFIFILMSYNFTSQIVKMLETAILYEKMKRV